MGKQEEGILLVALFVWLYLGNTIGKVAFITDFCFFSFESEKPKAPLPSLLELPSVKPAGDFNLETLKDEEGDRHGKQLRQGRNKGK